jgi:hypothetical protein
MLLINAGVTLLYMTSELQNDPVNIRPIKSLTGALSSAETTLSSLYFLTSVLSFILTWIATVILLKHYSRKLGKAINELVSSLCISHVFTNPFVFLINTMKKVEPLKTIIQLCPMYYVLLLIIDSIA